MQRLVTAIALIPVALYLIFLAPEWLFRLAALAMGGLCYIEFSGLAARIVKKPGPLGIYCGIIVLLAPSQHSLLGITLLLAIGLIVFLRKTEMREILPQAACALFGAFYTFAPWRFAIDLRHASVHLLFFALALNWVGDTAAYYAGRAFGRHPLAPVISPKKTWEGAIGSVIISVLASVLYLGYFVKGVPYWETTLMAVIGNIAGQFGDLVESAIKRAAGVKDSGTLLPGHGGMLDRVDSSLFSLPFVFGTYLLCEFLRSM